MYRGSIRVCVLLIITTGALLSRWDAWAAINPQEFRRGHPECVTIRIVASHLDESRDVTKVYLAAKVVEVFRTATDLTPGDLILVTYQQDHARVEKESAEMIKRAKTGWVGPQILSFPSVLKSGDVRLAHLAKLIGNNSSGGVYAPRAYQYSFEQEESKCKDQK
ncbi:MAG: hypothetical protein EP297_14415 [Gammaproteobacteria bacterium]|nr:MAG: hypothetical protein EP297_14415 [Gammaproteobacteria bacterium]